MIVRKSIYSGAVLEITEESERPPHRAGRLTAADGATSEKQEVLNKKQRMKKLMRLLNCNFCKGDLWITLTYAVRPDIDTAKKEEARFLRKLRNAYKRATGKPLRYIAVTEAGDKYGRLHHHIICKSFEITPAALLSMWGLGRVDIGTVDGDPYFRWLMLYIDKAERSIKGAKAYTCSRNLIKPTVAPVKRLKRNIFNTPPRVPKGYYILDWELVADQYGTRRNIVAIRHDKVPEVPKWIIDEIEKEKERRL